MCVPLYNIISLSNLGALCIIFFILFNKIFLIISVLIFNIDKYLVSIITLSNNLIDKLCVLNIIFSSFLQKCFIILK